LAPDCQKKEKAFTKTTTGKVLGIEFKTKILSWRLPAEKTTKYVNLVSQMLNVNTVTLSDMQTLMGCLNHVYCHPRVFKIKTQEISSFQSRFGDNIQMVIS
jgi:hypothetical protein